MKKYLLIAFLLGTLSAAQAQTIIINGKIGDRPLVWSDFQGAPDMSTPYAAMTAWNLKISMKGKSTNGGDMAMQGLDIILEFNPAKSWVKKGKENDELLKHEQGHFDIGRLCLMEMLLAIESVPASQQMDKLPKIYEALMKKYNDMGYRYDEETNHCLKRDKQQEWNAFLAAEEKRLAGR